MTKGSLQSLMAQCAVMPIGKMGKFRHQRILEDSDDEYTLIIEVWDRANGVTAEGETVLVWGKGYHCDTDHIHIRWKDVINVESDPIEGYWPCVTIRWRSILGTDSAEIWTVNNEVADSLCEVIEQIRSAKHSRDT